MNKEKHWLFGDYEITWHGTFSMRFLKNVGLVRFYKLSPKWWKFGFWKIELEYFVPRFE